MPFHSPIPSPEVSCATTHEAAPQNLLPSSLLAVTPRTQDVGRDKENAGDGVGGGARGPQTLGNGVALGVGFNHDLSQARIPMHTCPHCKKSFASLEYLAS